MVVRVAVIGAGVMGADHAKIIAQDVPNACLQLVCDMDGARARAVADATSAVDCTDGPEAALLREDIDAVIVASPDFTHAPYTKTLIARGKRVLCEKPLSQKIDECLDVMAAEQATGAHHIMVGFMRRYDRAYLDMREALAKGVLGRALMMHNFHRNLATPYPSFTGAMAITNSAPHEFDIARYLLGVEVTTITAHQPKRSDDVVAPVVMVLETDDDQLITVEVNNNAAYGYDVRAELVGELGSISTNKVAHSRLDARLSSAIRYDEDWRGHYHDAYVAQNRDFMGFVQTGILPEAAASTWDGYAAALVADTGVRALHSGVKERVEMIKKPAFYA